jgi:hypothetical protein
MARLAKRLRAGEKDVADRRAKCGEQQRRVADLQRQLEALEDGETPPPAAALPPGMHDTWHA